MMKAALASIRDWVSSYFLRGRRKASKLASIRDWVSNYYLRYRRTASKPMLVHKILSIQISSAALIGALAIASLYWGGQWILRDNYSRWALQWTEELNELGSPLFLSDDGEALIRLESFVDRYPEIDRVAYFTKDGAALFSVISDEGFGDVADLTPDRLIEATEVVGNNTPYLMLGDFLDPRQFEILAPVWIESISDDGLLAFDPSAIEMAKSTELLGFVRVRLDFVMYHDRLLANIRSAVMILLVLLIAFALYGRRALRTALASISDLHAPIKELAKGNLGATFVPAQHHEISEIVEALETTASALSERDAKLIELANHDSLTGLFNRRRFVEELKKEIVSVMRGGHTSSLFFIDLDQFKYINDACGHAAGDRLICKVADELQHSVRRGDVVARFGGDEFVVLQQHTDVHGAQSSAETILANMRRMGHFEGERVFHVHCSIGVTMLTRDNLHYDDLINQGDIACREAKSAGRNRMQFFANSDGTGQHDLADAGWMTRLRKAVDEDAFELHFQPINRIDTGNTTHHEVLIRLPSEDGKLISPDAFLPSAIRFGLMSEIDFWVIQNAAKAYAEYSQENSRLSLSINLSANAFENDDLPEFVEKTFDEYDVPPSRIILEITESLAIRRPRHVERQIEALRKYGCKIALDDFGTGYSSFAHLQQLQFDYIKIDGTFVENLLDNPVDQKMIKLIAEVGREAGMKTVAEYVQDAESFSLLGELGVDMAQGYFVGKPSDRPVFQSMPISLSLRRARLSEYRQ